MAVTLALLAVTTTAARTTLQKPNWSKVNAIHAQSQPFLDSGVSWLRRKLSLHFPPSLLVEEPAGEPGKLVFRADNCTERSLTLGEEHTEALPNGENAMVNKSIVLCRSCCVSHCTHFNQAVTVREGDNCLITRLKSPWNLEIRREFNQQGMVQVGLVESG